MSSAAAQGAAGAGAEPTGAHAQHATVGGAGAESPQHGYGHGKAPQAKKRSSALGCCVARPPQSVELTEDFIAELKRKAALERKAETDALARKHAELAAFDRAHGAVRGPVPGAKPTARSARDGAATPAQRSPKQVNISRYLKISQNISKYLKRISKESHSLSSARVLSTPSSTAGGAVVLTRGEKISRQRRASSSVVKAKKGRAPAPFLGPTRACPPA
eukprot:SAG31_NODE_6643_length_1941_cov_1.518458_2_plen_219_part_00